MDYLDSLLSQCLLLDSLCLQNTDTNKVFTPQKLAELKSIALAEVRNSTSENALKLFQHN